MRKRILMTGLAVFSLLLLAFNIWIFSKDEGAFARAQNVHLAPARVMDIKRTIVAEGAVVPSENEKFYVQEKLGYVKEIAVKEGDEVTPGTVLFVYGNTELDDEIADLQQKKEEYTVKEKHYQEMQTELQSQADALPADDPDSVKKKADLENEQSEAAMKSELATTRAAAVDTQLIQLNEEKENLSIKSNTTGVVKSISQGSSDTGVPVLEVVSTDDVQVNGELDEKDSMLVQSGEKATIVSPSLPGKKWEGTLAEFREATKVKGKAIFPFTVKFDQEHPFKTGQAVKIELKPVIKEDAVVIPETALMKEKQKTSVYMVEKGYLKKVPVKTGLEYGSWIEITSGIKYNNSVVSNPTPYLTENTEVFTSETKKDDTKRKDPAKDTKKAAQQ
ncbi:efflux RND transporter periplasmic adaptor subunit [Fictibacillus enclensis]|uniref:efflux RND transporter periplasmic adaptor subunit n=1 Tax=Fictibacillus enclensis TaxID=1017270 RepID=UPI0025A17DFF|nr:efflux RND transporter periplasmic adaptor subunit [Fictibacillus enclensis]MDM5198554.1 efflux RND transporter periplasmic adaptor subunit [Fictibacillus enclensis]